MTKRLIELDDDLLADAQRELHTTGVSDTVWTALKQVAHAAARARQIDWLRDGGLEPLADPEARAAACADRPLPGRYERRPDAALSGP